MSHLYSFLSLVIACMLSQAPGTLSLDNRAWKQRAQSSALVAAVEQKIAYMRELRAGDLVTIRSGLLEMREKVIRFVYEMRNDETQEVSAVAVMTGVHLDTETRRACPFPEEIAERGKRLVVSYSP